MKLRTKTIALLAALLLIADRGLAADRIELQAEAASPAPSAAAETIRLVPPVPTASGGSYSDSSDGGHAILADGENAFYTNITVNKTGDMSGDAAEFSGENAAILAANGAVLDLREISVTTDGVNAGAVFSRGKGTTVNIADSTVRTSGSRSGGLVTTDGGTMNARNLVIRTTGRSSAAIRSDRGGVVNIAGGTYSSDGADSPAICAGADVTVSAAELKSGASQGVVVEGSHVVTLENVTLTANDVEMSGKSARCQAVMLCQPASGDTAEGAASFSMSGGSLTNLNGDVFFVRNTDAVILLRNTEIVNDDPEGAFLRVEAADQGSGSRAELYAAAQEIHGDMAVDALSALNLHLGEGCAFTGAVRAEEGGTVCVALTDGAKWTLTGDSSVTSLSCAPDSIELNGFTLTVGGAVYTGGTAMEGAPAAR